MRSIRLYKDVAEYIGTSKLFTRIVILFPLDLIAKPTNKFKYMTIPKQPRGLIGKVILVVRPYLRSSSVLISRFSDSIGRVRIA